VKIRYLPSGDALGEIRLHRPARELRAQHGVDIQTVPVHKEVGKGKVGGGVVYRMDNTDVPDVLIVQNHAALAVSPAEVQQLIAGLERKQAKHRGRLDPDKVAQHLMAEKLQSVRSLQAAGAKLVIDLDDDYQTIPAWNSAFHAIPRWMIDGIFTLAAQADMVTVSTPALVARYGRHNTNVKLLPNYLDRDMWPLQGRRQDGELRLGWYGGFSHRGGDLELLRDVIPQTLERYPHVTMLIGGPGKDDAFLYLDVPEDRRVYRDTRLYERLPELLDFDIGVVPLAQCQFNQGKSALKGMEMNACGIPYVASPSAPYHAYTRDGENGYLAGGPELFRRKLWTLIEDGTNRRIMGAYALRHVKGFMLQDHVGEWLEAYESVLAQEPVAA
jgi:glycosyltransferase involved in cell wall biosynthesis